MYNANSQLLLSKILTEQGQQAIEQAQRIGSTVQMRRLVKQKPQPALTAQTKRRYSKC